MVHFSRQTLRKSFVESGVFVFSVKLIWCLLCVSGRAGEAAAAGQPHIRGLWQRKDCQERQLFKICKSRSYCRRWHKQIIFIASWRLPETLNYFPSSLFRVNSSALISTWRGTSLVPTLRPVSFYMSLVFSRLMHSCSKSKMHQSQNTYCDLLLISDDLKFLKYSLSMWCIMLILKTKSPEVEQD